jgi:hypothetical protein
MKLYYYGARYYNDKWGLWLGVDPMADKYPGWSPFVYCANNPVIITDPDGMDWFKDTDGSVQFDPKINKDSKLGKDQSYLGETYQQNSKGSSTQYRKDGSILFSNETKAYNRMWSQANRNKREVGGFTLTNGSVLVLPEYDNDDGEIKYQEYGYSISKARLSNGNERFAITSLIHTHQDKTRDASPSFYTKNGGWGDIGVSKEMGGLPVFTIGHDGNVHGANFIQGTKGFGTIDMGGLTKDALLGGTKLTPWLNTYPTKKK